MNFLNLTDTSMSLEAVKEKLMSYCATPWSKVGEHQCICYTSQKCSATFINFHVLSMSDVYFDNITAFVLLEQISQQHPNVKPKYLSEYCFSGTYIFILLTQGYNFTSETYSKIEFIKKVSRSGCPPVHTPDLWPHLYCVCATASRKYLWEELKVSKT